MAGGERWDSRENEGEGRGRGGSTHWHTGSLWTRSQLAIWKYAWGRQEGGEIRGQLEGSRRGGRRGLQFVWCRAGEESRSNKRERRLHSHLLLQSWFTVSLEGQQSTTSSSQWECYGNCWVHLVIGASTELILPILSTHSATASHQRATTTIDFNPLCLFLFTHFIQVLRIFIHSQPSRVSLHPNDDAIAAIHHFPLILYHDPRWMQTNGSDLLAAAFSFPSSFPFMSPNIYPSRFQFHSRYL